MMGKMAKETEVVVVGGGIIGSATAYYLARAGKDVVLMEKNELASGSSGANAGLTSTTWCPPGPLLQMSMASLKEYDYFSQELAWDIEFERCGRFTVCETEQQFEEMKPFVEVRNKGGNSLRLIDRNELLELEPNLSPSLFGAVFAPNDGHVNPLYAVYAFADAARELGAKIYEYTEPVAINAEHGCVKAIATNKGEIKTKYIINACGIGAPVVSEMVGLKIPIIPNREQMLVSEEMPPILNRVIINAGYMKDVQPTGLGDSAARKKSTQTVGTVCNQTKKGNLLLVGVNDFVGEDERTTFESFPAISEGILRVLPILRTYDVQIIRSFAKFYIYTPDQKPILGKVDGLEGFIMASGVNDYGICFGPIIGKLLSDLICIGETTIPIDEFNLSRFG